MMIAGTAGRGGEGGASSNGGNSSSSSSSSTGNRWTARIFGLLLLFLQLEVVQVHSQITSTGGGGGGGAAGDSHYIVTKQQQKQDVVSMATGGGTSDASDTSSAPDPSAMDGGGGGGFAFDEDPASLFPAGIPMLSEEAATSLLLFQPRMLNFADRSIGDPHNQLVMLFNRHKNRSIYLGLISGSAAEFSSSYFKETVIPPGGNTSFNVVFLPRKLGPAEGTLLIHTSFGMVRYQVQGEGIECPYRLRPLVGLQAPLNATLSPEITLYNPHDTPLQIVEIYSSGGNFQLELPSGAQEGPQALWEIPPHSTRTVIRVRFHARTPGNHIAYVRIKISGGDAEPSLIEKMLVVPIEVEIFKETGLYSRIPFLELGVTSAAGSAALAAASAVAAPIALGRTERDDSFPRSSEAGGDRGVTVGNSRNSTWLSLDLLNSGSQPVKVKSWGVQADDIESVLCMHVLVAEERTLHVEFDWSKLSSDRRHISGRILLNLERVAAPSDGQEADDQRPTADAVQQQQQQNVRQSESHAAWHDVVGKLSIFAGGELLGRKEDAKEDLGAEALGSDTATVPADASVPVLSVYAIPFAGEVLKGSIQYNEEVLRFLLPVRDGDEHPDGARRPLVIRNQFHVPLSITNISVPENCSRYFTIEDFRPLVLQPNDERTMLRISRKLLTDGGHRWPASTIATYIRLTTNITDYELPVLGYRGKLQRILSPAVRDASLLTGLPAITEHVSEVEEDGEGHEEIELDFGVLPIATIGEALVAFVNPNPVPIPIIHWKGAITSEAAVGAPTITVILRGCGALRLDELVFCHTVQPGEWIVYQISVQSGTIDSYQGRFTVKTDYEEIVTPLRFTTAVGELHLARERLRFTDCFPGKVCSVPLVAASTFPSKIHIEGICTEEAGLSWEFLSPDKQRPLPPSQPVVLYPESMATIGRLLLDPKHHCGSECYSSFDLLSKPFGVKWMATLDSYADYRQLDSDKLLQQLQRYAEMRQQLTSVHFQMLAESNRRFDFNASVELSWPKLLDENVFFPTLQVEQEAVKLITINNPSDQILFVHLVLHDVTVHGPAPELDGAVPLPTEVLTACSNCTLSPESVFSFFLFDNDDIYVNYVKPQSFLRIAVKFTARQPGTYSTVLYMRNNLTLIDAAWIQARAVVPQFKFGNRRPGSPTALQFELTEKHLRHCGDAYFELLRADGAATLQGAAPYGSSSESGSGGCGGAADGASKPATTDQRPAREVGELEPGVETRRTFTARNYGEVPIVISGIRIEEALCEGYGFKVLDCAPFELAPNATRKIEIAFAPDFTLSRVVRMLHFDTNMNNFAVNFTLLGTVPTRGLDICGKSLQRPWFEQAFRVFLMVAVSIALLGTVVAAFLESNRVLRNHFLGLMREKGPVQPPLDLRQIALQHSAATAQQAATVGDEKGSRDAATTSHRQVGAGTLLSRNNRKGDRSKASGNSNAQQHQTRIGSLQNGTASATHATGSTESSVTSRLSRTWSEFTANLGRVSGRGKTSAPEASKGHSSGPVKSRRSNTPPKEQREGALRETVNSSGTGSTKESRASKAIATLAQEEGKIVPDGAGSDHPGREEPNGRGQWKSNKPVATITSSDLTEAFESNSSAAKQQKQHNHHHHTTPSTLSSSVSSLGTNEDSLSSGSSSSSSSSSSCSSSSSSASSLSSSSSSVASSSSSSPSPSSTKQQNHQQKQSSQPTPKSNVKKTKSLSGQSYESVVVSLATVFMVTAGSGSSTPATITTSMHHHPSQPSSTTTTTTSSLTAPAMSIAATPGKDSRRSPMSETSSTGERSGGKGSRPSGATNGKQSTTTATIQSTKGGTAAGASGSRNGTEPPIITSSKTGLDRLAFLMPPSHASEQSDHSSSNNNSSGSSSSSSTSSSSAGGKENKSSGGNMILPTFGIAGVNQIESVQQQQSVGKKFSKTPGRERKSNQTKKGATTTNNGKPGATQQYKGTALQFNGPSQHKSTTLGTILQNASVTVPTVTSTAASTVAPTSATVWGENCARFSDVVAQTPSSKPSSSGHQLSSSSSSSSMACQSNGFGMDLIAGLASLAGQSLSDSSHHRTLGNVFGANGSSSGSGNVRNSTLQQASLGNGVGGELVKDDDSYKPHSSKVEAERESCTPSAPFIVTGGPANLGPIGTTKKSPTGNGIEEGTDSDGTMFGRQGIGGGIAKCWEPFGGQLIHNPRHLAATRGSDSSIVGSTSTNNGGNHHSDSLFSQSFADLQSIKQEQQRQQLRQQQQQQQQQQDPYRGIPSSMAGTSNGLTTTSLGQHSRGFPITGNNGTTAGSLVGVGNDFVGNRNAAAMLLSQQQPEWNQGISMGSNNSLDWSLSSHKFPSSASATSGLRECETAELYNFFASQTQYQQHLAQSGQQPHSLHPQPQLDLASSSMLYSSDRLAMAQAQGFCPMQVPSLTDINNVTEHPAVHYRRPNLRPNDSWQPTQSAIAPPPGFSNLLSTTSGTTSAITNSTYVNNLLHLQQHLQSQQQQQHQMLIQAQQHHQQLQRQRSSDEAQSSSSPTVVGRASPTALHPTAAAATSSSASSSGSSASLSSASSSSAASSSSSSMVAPTSSTYDPFQLSSIWTSASISDPWAANRKK
ncbi:transmembrane protein 131-like [Anopheles albimanus]|uniref:transmembrane protein 131-like n=1 Tax=Anopheles albimanus TaxID=7167 RepID=UPI00164111C1|nr:transmembrane protein 131-like [Anopheles albimanus]XP_035778466.1 transmembrane protein 131-like [Anopheles albimanus]XP_035778468.1 transmembrane protein 131-like [Anopheles albimanus]